MTTARARARRLSSIIHRLIIGQQIFLSIRGWEVKHKSKILLGVLLMTVLAVTACAREQDLEAGPIRWKAQAGMPANSWSYEYQFSKFAELVNERSGGRLVIEVFPPGTIVDAYEQFSAVQRKAIEVGMGVGGYNLKQIPEAYIEQGLFGTFLELEDVVDFYIHYKDGEVYQLLDAAYREKGCHLLRSLGPSHLTLISRTPIHTVEEIKGLKIKGSGAQPELIKNLGAVPVTLAPAEHYLALQTGTIDGLIVPSYTIGTTHLWDVGKGLLRPTLGQVAGNIYVNLEAYDSLSDDLKKIVEDAAEEAMTYYVKTITRNLEEMLETAQKEHGVTIVTLSDQEYDKILKAAAPILDVAAGRSPRSAEIIKLMKEYLLEKGSPMSRFLQ